MVYGFDNLQIFSVKDLANDTTSKPIRTYQTDQITTEPEITTAADTTDNVPNNTVAVPSTTSMTSTTTTSIKPINELVYFCDFDNFKDEDQCSGTIATSTISIDFDVSKTAFIKDTEYYLTDVTSISNEA